MLKTVVEEPLGISGFSTTIGYYICEKEKKKEGPRQCGGCSETVQEVYEKALMPKIMPRIRGLVTNRQLYPTKTDCIEVGKYERQSYLLGAKYERNRFSSTTQQLVLALP